MVTDQVEKWAVAFESLSKDKTLAAEAVEFPPMQTVMRGELATRLPTIGNPWTRRAYDGGFVVLPAREALPAVSLVFVQSKDGNTGSANPADLGGGPIDHHLIYEGLSRASAGAVLAGATTAAGPNVFFSVWHPELVALRAQLGLARHPIQIVVSRDGHLDVAGTLLFNVRDVPVVVLAGAACRRDRARDFAERPWIDVMPFDDRDWRRALTALRGKYRIHRISAVGGRSTAASLLDAGVVTDICLTTTSHNGGEKNTPYYNGPKPPRTSLILRKSGGEPHEPIVVEQLGVV